MWLEEMKNSWTWGVAAADVSTSGLLQGCKLGFPSVAALKKTSPFAEASAPAALRVDEFIILQASIFP